MKLLQIPRELSLACKLTNKNIIEAKKLRNKGYSLRYIANIYKVDHKTIRIAVMSEKNKHQYYKEMAIKYPSPYTMAERVQMAIKSKKRKIQIFGKEQYYKNMREYDKNRRQKRKTLNNI